jgi:hypothetical protein
MTDTIWSASQSRSGRTTFSSSWICMSSVDSGACVDVSRSLQPATNQPRREPRRLSSQLP